MPDTLSPSHLERALFATIRYFSLQHLPVTATQLWRCLILPAPEEGGVRWGGHHRYSLREVHRALAESVWLRERVAHQWGYYQLAGEKADAVARRLRRYTLAQEKWKILRRVVRYLAYVPFVQMLAVTGSLSFNNARPSSDLDLLIVTTPGRIWTARALLLLTAALLRRRRRHWDQRAPDKACLNHYVTTRSLAVAPDIRNVYTAVLFTHAVPVYGATVHRAFIAENESWLKRYVMYPEPIVLSSAHALRVRAWTAILKQGVERWLSEPVGAWIERRLRTFQERIIQRHTVPGRPGRIVVSETELAFHPDSKMERVLTLFAQDVGQRALL